MIGGLAADPVILMTGGMRPAVDRPTPYG